MEVEDDGRIRTGTVRTATAHVVTAILGSGILALPWSVAQMGWVLGPLILIAFAFVTCYTAILLSDCYRSPHPITGKRNYTYMDAVKSCLGDKHVVICGLNQYASLWTTLPAYTTTAAQSMMSIKRSSCYRKKGPNGGCPASATMFAVVFGIIEIVLSQFPNLEKIALLSEVAATMSFLYSSIGLYLSIAKFAHNKEIRGSLTGAMTAVGDISTAARVWNVFQALGNIAFAYSCALVEIEIQDTVKSPPPENRTMKRAATYGIGATTLFYVTLGCFGYAAFGNNAPGDLFTEFHEPFWLVQIANLALIIHLFGGYQVYVQPIFSLYEKWLASKWPNADFFHKIYTIRFSCANATVYHFTLSQLLLRTLFVAFTTVVTMVFPFFNPILGLSGAIGFWPLTVYYPIRMYTVQMDIKKGRPKWWCLQAMSMVCSVITVAAIIGSVAGMVDSLKHVKLFQM